MNNGWPIVRLGELLTRRKDEITVQPMEFYSRLTIRMNGKGIVVRDRVQGHQIGTKNQFVAKAGQLVLSKIDARNGAFGVLPDECDGAIITGNFWAFEANRDRLDVRYLNYLTKTPLFIDFCIRASDGTTNRLYLQEPKFLAREIPLPPVTEQRRIVVRIEQLAAQIEAARRLRHQATEETEALVSSALHQVFVTGAKRWKTIPMPEAVAINDRQVDPRLPEYAKLPHINGENMESITCNLLPYRTAEEDGVKSSNYLFAPGAILYSKIRPYLRKVVFVDFQGVCSADIYPVKVTSDELEPRFVMWSLVAGPFTDYANTLSGRTRMPKLNRKQFFAFELAYPEKAEQRRLVAYLDGLAGQVARLARLQTETAAELDALLPSILDKAFKGEL